MKILRRCEVSDSMNRYRWTLSIVMSVTGFVVSWLASQHHLGWKVAAALSYFEVALVCAYLLWTRDALIGHLLVFAAIVGFGELPSDAFSVLVKHTVVYAPGEPMIWASPLYMPFTWMAVMVQMGFISWWLSRRMKLWIVMGLLAVLGGLYVPVYEYLAHGAGFYYYQNCRMLMGVTPYYVILAEALLCAALPPLVRRIDEQSWPWWIGLGVIESVIVLGVSVLAFGLVG
jgi:hypothetical protein